MCHGGINSVMESIMYNVKLICLPQNLERLLISKLVKLKGLGDYIGPDGSASEIRDLAITVNNA